MTDARYSLSFLITVAIYSLIGLLFLSFSDEIKKKEIPKPKRQVVRIALVSPITTKAKEKIKKVEPKKEKPKPKPKKKIVKKKKKKVVKKKRVVKKKIVKKHHSKEHHLKKKIVKKEIVKKKIVKEVIIQKKPKRVIPTPMPIIEEYIPEPTVAPIIYEPPPPIIYTHPEPPQEIYTQPIINEPAPAPIVTIKPQVAQQRYIINDPTPKTRQPQYVQPAIQQPAIQQPAIRQPQYIQQTPQYVQQQPIRQQHKPVAEQPAYYAPPPPNHNSLNSDFANEKRAFKQNTRNIINSNKRYPNMAKRRHIQGTVHVIFDILANGEIVNIRTSGASSILQKSARKSVIASSPLSVPSVLQSQFPMNNVSVNIDFRLQ